MANKLDPMDLKQIISLHLDGVSNRQIAEVLGISRNTINQYIRLIGTLDFTASELLEFERSKLAELFTTRTTINNDRYVGLMDYFDSIHLSRNHPGFTLQYHYHEYCNEVSNPYGYTQFTEHYNRRYKQPKGSMKLEHEAGKEVYIDYAGKHLNIVDKETGEVRPVEVFVALLPHSQYTYVEACYSQKREDLLHCMAGALSYFGGVPKAIVSDNLKSAVSRASKYEPEVNRTFKDFARHYNCVINPTRSYAPQDKALVENAVNLTYQRIYYPLRNMTFFSLEDLNREIKKLLERYNDAIFSQKQSSRKELFQSVERSHLKPLPTAKYEMKEYRRAKVQKMGYVYFSPDKSYYSVPYSHIGKHTMIHYTQSSIEVYYNHERIALHKRNLVSGVYNTNKEHLSSTHKFYCEWSPDFFINKAKAHGQYVVELISKLMQQTDYPETAYKRAMGIIQLNKAYGSERLNKACQLALFAGTTSYKRVDNILRNKLDKNQLPNLSETKSHIPVHNNLRGSQSYQ